MVVSAGVLTKKQYTLDEAYVNKRVESYKKCISFIVTINAAKRMARRQLTNMLIPSTRRRKYYKPSLAKLQEL